MIRLDLDFDSISCTEMQSFCTLKPDIGRFLKQTLRYYVSLPSCNKNDVWNAEIPSAA